MRFKLEGIDNLFPIPLWRYRVDDHERLNAALLDEIAVRQKKDKDIANRNRRGWQSAHDFFDRKEPAQAELADVVRKLLVDALKAVSREIKADKVNFSMNGWVNVNPPGGYIGPHAHPNGLISGSYYVSVPNEQGPGGSIEFVCPHAVSYMGGFIKAPMLVDKLRVHPKPGEVLLFPSQLLHWVLPNDSDEDRVTVAFNLGAKPKAGTVLG
jgi:uncharacterized protein (TIGR02466 family)